MKLSAKWQKFYKWYCIAYCALTAILILLIAIGGPAWNVRSELIHTTAVYLGFGLGVCVIVFPLNYLLWFISLIVWLCRRNSARGWHILGYGLLISIVGFVEVVAYGVVSGA